MPVQLISDTIQSFTALLHLQISTVSQLKSEPYSIVICETLIYVRLNKSFGGKRMKNRAHVENAADGEVSRTRIYVLHKCHVQKGEDRRTGNVLLQTWLFQSDHV